VVPLAPARFGLRRVSLLRVLEVAIANDERLPRLPAAARDGGRLSRNGWRRGADGRAALLFGRVLAQRVRTDHALARLARVRRAAHGALHPRLQEIEEPHHCRALGRTVGENAVPL